LHGTEALVVGQFVSGVLKVALGRARPYISTDTNPGSFAFGRGSKNSDFQSFPSGHATAAFAAAAAVSSETSEWWPETRWIFGTILYGGAAFVGLSRMYDDKHWASDVVMGAAVGTFAGLKVTRFNHTHAGNRIDRFFLGKKGADPHLQLHPGVDGSLGVGLRFDW
jgi:membrane-associated phospholipid phosphatase